jgi:hypothetical protein
VKEREEKRKSKVFNFSTVNGGIFNSLNKRTVCTWYLQYGKLMDAFFVGKGNVR